MIASSRRIVTVGFLVAAVALTAFALDAAGSFTAVSLRVGKQTAPPGGMAQMKLEITEPRPISTGDGYFRFDAYASVDGIALINSAEDAAGIALVRGTEVALSFVSPTGTFGTDPDYPLLTVAGRIPADAPIGTKFPLDIAPDLLRLYDPAGALYPVEVKSGHLVTAPGVSIHEINPGSALVPAGGVVRITGSNFEPGTKIRFNETVLAQVRYIDAGRIDVVLAQDARMHGMEVKATNPDGSRAIYFSYQRTKSMPLSDHPDPVLQFAVPLTSPLGVTSASVPLPEPAVGSTYGLALQNLEPTDAVVSVDLLNAGGRPIGAAVVSVSPNRYLVRELSELFGFAPATASTLRATSATPVGVLGIVANQATKSARPILAR